MKRILSALLCAALLLGLCICSPAVSAADADSTAAQAVKAPVIDGEIDKIWDTTPALDGVVCDMGPDWTMEDLLDMDMATGYTKVLWAEDALYFLAVVYDKTMESDASSTTNGINFWVSETNSGNGSFNDAPGDYHYFCNADGGTNYYTGNKDVYNQADCCAVRTSDGYIVELEVPILTDGLTLGVGSVIGYNISIDDDHDGDNNRDSFTSWQTYDGRPYWEKPEALNTLELTGEGHAQPVDVCNIPMKAAVIDGVISEGEWDNATPLTLNISDTSTWNMNGAGIVGTDGWKQLNHTDDDFTTSLSMMVEDHFLYLLLTRTDSTLMFCTDNYHRPYSSDGALMWFYDTEYTSQYGIQLLPEDKGGTPHVGYFFMDADQNSSDDMAEQGACEVKTVATENSYVMEAKIDMNAMDDLTLDMLRSGNLTVTYCAVNICEEGWDSDDEVNYALWGTYNYQAQYKGVNDWDFAPVANVVAADGSKLEAPTPESNLPEGYPSSGYTPKSGSALVAGEVIGLENGWDGTAASGRASAFDGQIATFFDPLGTGDGWCGIDAGGEYTLTAILIHPRTDWLDRFNGGTIEGSMDPEFENAVEIWSSTEAAPALEWQIIEQSDFDEAGSFRYYRYINYTNHGDVADIELYGYASDGDYEKQEAARQEAAKKAAEEAAAKKAEAEAAKAAEEAAKAAEEAAAAAAEAVTDAVEGAAEAVSDAAETVAEEAKSGCGSVIGGGLIVLLTILGCGWISSRRD